MDGSMAGYYVRKGTDSNLFVIFFEGGGVCTGSQKCLARSFTEKGSSKSYGRWHEYLERDTFLDHQCSENPDFCRATAVYIPYCTSDSHRGTAEKSDAPGWNNQYYFDGHSNFRAIVEKLVDENNLKNSANTKVLLTGSSAGAIGAFYNGEWLMKRLPTAVIKAVPFSGWFLPGSLPGDLPAIYGPSNYTNFASGVHGNTLYDTVKKTGNYPDIWKMKDVLPAGCLDHFVNETHDFWWACASMHNAYRYMEMPIFNIHSQYDNYIMFNGDVTGGGAPKLVVNPAEMDTVRSYVDMMGKAHRHSFQQILDDNVEADKMHADGVFSASCMKHGIPSSVKINGMGWREIVGDWFFQRRALTDRYRQVEECGNTNGFVLPCNTADMCKLLIPSPVVTACTQAMKEAGCLDSINKKACLSCAQKFRNKIEKGGCKVAPHSVEKLAKDICRANYKTMATLSLPSKTAPMGNLNTWLTESTRLSLADA